MGGLERYVRELSSQLVLDGHHVSIIAKSAVATFADAEVMREDDGVEVIRYAAPAKTNPLFAAAYPVSVYRSVRQAFALAGLDDSRAARDTVVHGHFPIPILPAIAKSLPYLYTFHAPLHKEILGERQDSYLLPRPVQRPATAAVKMLDALVLRRARRVTTLSEYMRGEALSLLRNGDEKIRVIPGGMDTSHFSPDSSQAMPRILPAGPVILTARRLVERTGVENLVRAMPQILGRIPTAQLVVLGEGPRRPAIEEFVARHGLDASVHLLGRVSEEELLGWYRSATIAVTPTYELEGFGLATAEALACGTPALVTPVGANPEVVSGLGRDFITNGYEADEIAAAVTSLLSAPERLAEAGGRARSLVHPALGWPEVADRMVSQYDELLAGRH